MKAFEDCLKSTNIQNAATVDGMSDILQKSAQILLIILVLEKLIVVKEERQVKNVFSVMAHIARVNVK